MESERKKGTHTLGREDFSGTLDIMNGGGREGLVTEVANQPQQARQATCLLSGGHRGVCAETPDLEGVGDAQSRARDAAPPPAGLGD